MEDSALTLPYPVDDAVIMSSSETCDSYDAQGQQGQIDVLKSKFLCGKEETVRLKSQMKLMETKLSELCVEYLPSKKSKRLRVTSNPFITKSQPTLVAHPKTNPRREHEWDDDNAKEQQGQIDMLEEKVWCHYEEALQLKTRMKSIETNLPDLMYRLNLDHPKSKANDDLSYSVGLPLIRDISGVSNMSMLCERFE